MVTLTKLQSEGRITWSHIIYSNLVTMTRTKAVTPSMPYNIYRILEYVGVPMRMFSVNFWPEQFNWTLPTPSTERRSEDELRTCPLIEKPTIPRKLDGKVTLIPIVWVVRPSLP